MNSSLDRKIKKIDELGSLLARLKKSGKTVVQCHGVFDLVHLGHVRHFAAAKKEGDILVVTVTRDKYVKRGPGRPIFNEHLRAEMVASLAMVDFVALADASTATEVIRALKPDVYVKGQDYRDRSKDVTGKIYEEEEAVRAGGGRIAFTDEITFSSSNLINNYLETYPSHTAKYLRAVAAKYPLDTILQRLERIRKMKILVIGDAIIDEYRYCTPMGKSSKEPIVVNRYVSEEAFAGGSLAAANHIAQVSDKVELLTLLGKQVSYEPFILDRLSTKIRPRFHYRANAMTTVKRRYLSQEHQNKLFEVCYLEDHWINGGEEKKILKFLNANIRKYDLVIVTDYGHGLMTPALVKLVSRKARKLAVNVQTNSANVGFNLITKYPKAHMVCIDEQELRLATHDKFSDLRTLLKKAYAELGAELIVATRGQYGSLSYSKKEGFHASPALSYKIVDKVGAGDAFFAYTAPCFAAGFPADLVSFIGNAVGSIAVQIVCNREPVHYVDLAKFMTRLLKV